MKKWIEWTLNRPVTVTMFYLGIVLLGVLSLGDLPVELFPPLQYPELVIRTAYKNALPREVEQNLTRPLEEAVAAGGATHSVFSRSMQGVSWITARYAWGTDMRLTALMVRQQLDRVADYLPRSAGRPVIVHKSPENRPFLTLALSGAGETALARMADYVVRRRLEQIRGVAYAAVNGAPQREIYVEYDPVSLRAWGITPKDIETALSDANVRAPAGRIKNGHYRLSLRVESVFTSVDQIADTWVRPEKGPPLRLKKIARVYEGARDRTSLTRINGAPCVTVDVYKEASGNTLAIAAAARAVIDTLRRNEPRVRMDVVTDQSRFVRAAVDGMEQSLLVGAVLAFAVLFLFLRSRAAPLIIGVTIPVSLLAALIGMKFLGYSVNLISLAGLALGSGMLVDNAIVVLENIHRHLEQGASPFRAALNGTAEVAMPVTASTLTTLAVFLPVIFLQDLSGAIFGEQAATASLALGASLLAALTLAPPLFLFLNKKRAPRGATTGQNRLYSLYHTLMLRALRYPRQTLGVTALALLIALVSLFFNERSLLPETETRNLHVTMRFAPGTAIGYMSAESRRWERIGRRAARPCYVFSRVGRMENIMLAVEDPGDNSADVLLADGAADARQAAGIITDSLPRGARIRYRVSREQPALRQLAGENADALDIFISGASIEVLDSLSADVARKLRAALPRAAINSGFFEKTPVWELYARRERMARFGVSVDDVARALRASLAGDEATRFHDFDKNIAVISRAARPYRESIDRLLQTPASPSDRPVGDFVDVRPAFRLRSIDRHNQSRVFRLRLTSQAYSLGRMAQTAQQVLNAQKWPSAYRAYAGGSWQEAARSARLLLLAFLISVVLVYLLLASQFESFRIPFVIMLTVPLALIGVGPALWLTGQHLSVMAFIGLIVTVGIVVNDGIVKVEFIERRRRDGLDMDAAILDAGQARLRPILMTTVTTVLGLLPLAFGWGSGAELQRPMAIAIVGGISMATLLTLFVLPLLYKILASKKVRKNA